MKDKDIQDMLDMHQGLIEILMGFMTTHIGRDEFIKFVRLVAKDDRQSRAAKVAAQLIVTDDSSWGNPYDNKKQH